MSLGPAEILVIFVIALLVFGPNRLPEVGRQVGKGVRELRKFQQTLKSDLDDVLGDDLDLTSPSDPAPQLPPLPAPDTPLAVAPAAPETDAPVTPESTTDDAPEASAAVDVGKQPTQPPDPT